MLNQMVRGTNPGDATTQLIDEWYEASGGVDQVGATQQEDAVVPGWVGLPQENLYTTVVGPYCRVDLACKEMVT